MNIFSNRKRLQWEDRVRSVAQYIAVDTGSARSCAKQYARTMSNATLSMLLRLAKTASPKRLLLPVGISSLDSGLLWKQGVSLIIASSEPFPIAWLRQRVGGISIDQSDAFVLALSLVYAAENDGALVSVFGVDLAMLIGKLPIQDVIMVLGTVKTSLVADAVSRGLVFHENEIKASALSCIVIASMLVAAKASSAITYVREAYKAVDDDLILSLRASRQVSGDWVIERKIVVILTEYARLVTVYLTPSPSSRPAVPSSLPAHSDRSAPAS